MSMICLFVLILGAAAAVCFNRRRTSLALLTLVVALFLLIGGGLVPQIALNGLQTRVQLVPNWQARNVIVLLGVGSVLWPQSGLVTSHTLGFSRIHEAARLYFDCKKRSDSCVILTAGGDPSRTGISEAETMARELKEIGVAENDLLV